MVQSNPPPKRNRCSFVRSAFVSSSRFFGFGRASRYVGLGGWRSVCPLGHPQFAKLERNQRERRRWKMVKVPRVLLLCFWFQVQRQGAEEAAAEVLRAVDVAWKL